MTLTVAGVLALAAAGVALAAALGDGDSEKKCARFRLDVEATPDAPADTYTLTGRGWLPDKRVEITHGTACSASGACDDRDVTVRVCGRIGGAGYACTSGSETSRHRG